MSYVKRWCFTLNNYTELEIANITSNLTSDRCFYAVVGKEVGENNTPHLQGYVHLRVRKRLIGMKKMISEKAHFEVARGTDEDNKKYCTKDGDILVEIGEPVTKPCTNLSYIAAKELADKVVCGEDLEELMDGDERYVEAYAKHSSFVENVIRIKGNAIGLREFIDENTSENVVMFEWQSKLYDLLTRTEPHKRKIYWYVDFDGGAGKSTFCNYFMCRHKAVCFFGGRLNDLSYAYNREPVVFFDLSRSGANEYLFGFMEQLKNGRVFSSKYQSGFKFFKRPHVIVFSNSMPPVDAFSGDRIEVYIIRQNKILKCSEEGASMSKDESQRN